MQTFNYHNRILLRDMIKNNCIVQGDFRLRSGQKTDIFVDLKKVSSNRTFQILYSVILNEMIEDLKIEYDRFWGVPTGGDPLADAANYFLSSQPGPNIIILEDVMTTGQSVINIDNLKWIQARYVVSVVDRAQGKPEHMATWNYDYMFLLEELL